MRFVAGLLGLLVLFSGCQSEKPQATIATLSGAVQCKSLPSAPFKTANTSDSLFPGGAVKTDQNSSAKLAFVDKSEVLVQADTYFEIGSTDSFATQNSGGAIFRFQKQSHPAKIITPHGTTAVLGTVFRQDVSSESVTIWVDEGKVSFTPTNGKEETLITAGQKLVAGSSGQPLKPEAANPVELESQISGNAQTPEFNRR